MTTSHRLLCIALCAAAPALAQDIGSYNKALTAYNQSQFEDSARAFYDVYNNTADADLRLKSEYYLASSFQRAGLPFTAFVYFDSIVKAGPSHPFHNKAMEAYVTLQEVLNDTYIIPAAIERLYDKYNAAWATLPPEVLARINYLIGTVDYRRSRYDEAKQFLEAVERDSTVFVKAQYLLAITISDNRFPVADEEERRKYVDLAIEMLENVLKNNDPRQRDLTETHYLATLGLGRLNYNLGEYGKAVAYYERVPRFSKYWDQALFENGFARFQADDLGGGLGSLQALHAPQFAGAFQPESWVLKSTIYYFSCLYEEAKAALAEFDSVYKPQAEKLRTLLEGEKDLAEYFKLVDTTESDVVPKAVLNFVRSDERMLGLFQQLKQIELEKAKLNSVDSWKAAKMPQEVVVYLDQNRGLLEQTAGRAARARLQTAASQIKFFSDQADIIRFETAKGEKEFAERGIDQAALLRAQRVYRPKQPKENWNYWRFQGEFWRDEIGFYQYTLRRGCPAEQ